MIIKGSCRGGTRTDAFKLARHLLAHENERVVVLELRGVASRELPEAIDEMRAMGLATKSRRPLYHSSISPSAQESLSFSQNQWIDAADELERRLGFVGHQRAIIQHIKKGREHAHVVWSRVDPHTLRVTHDSQNYRGHEQTARALERRWGLQPVTGAHDRPRGVARPVAAIRHRELQAQARTGIAVAAVAAILKEHWRISPNGKSFASAVSARGLSLASGRRGIVIVDQAGTPYSPGQSLQVNGLA